MSQTFYMVGFFNGKKKKRKRPRVSTSNIFRRSPFPVRRDIEVETYPDNEWDVDRRQTTHSFRAECKDRK